MNQAAPPSPLFDYVEDWPSIRPAEAEAIRRFWLQEGALGDEARIAERLPQVVLHACAADGSVAGVCTAVAVTPPQLGQPLYFWRCFVGLRWRTTPLVRVLLKRSCALLETYAMAHGYPCIGILLELENARFRDTVRAAEWWNPRFTYIGRSTRGLDLRVRYFKGARLQPPAD